MAWEWSHTAEAYENVKHNLHTLDDETLADILAEWYCEDYEKRNPNKPCPYTGSNVYNYKRASYLERLKRQRKFGNFTWKNNSVISRLYDRMADLATCDNGGHNAYCCPEGCHTVPFNRIEDDEN